MARSRIRVPKFRRFRAVSELLNNGYLFRQALGSTTRSTPTQDGANRGVYSLGGCLNDQVSLFQHYSRNHCAILPIFRVGARGTSALHARTRNSVSKVRSKARTCTDEVEGQGCFTDFGPGGCEPLQSTTNASVDRHLSFQAASSAAGRTPGKSKSPSPTVAHAQGQELKADWQGLVQLDRFVFPEATFGSLRFSSETWYARDGLAPGHPNH